MSSADVRDMLDLPSEVHPRPTKKQKVVEKRPEGITRELFALLGERAPPVAISEQRKYKEKPKWSQKASRWEMVGFTNSARSDGLVLYHWRKKDSDVGRAGPTTTHVAPRGESDAMDIDTISKTESSESTKPPVEYPWAKLDLHVKGLRYTDEQYNNHLQNENWTKDETDYLIDTVMDCDLRWPIIWDRYDYHPRSPSPELKPEQEPDTSPPSKSLVPAQKPKTRALEDLKARYYTIAAKTMAFHTPPTSMTTAEFDAYEKMLKFDPEVERKRKRMAETLLYRSADDVAEEELMLGELQRIMRNEERLMLERRELFTRLESPATTSNTAAMYQTSQALTALWHQLLFADKNKKKRMLIGAGNVDSSMTSNALSNTPVSSSPAPSATTSAHHHHHRDSLTMNARKASTSVSVSTHPMPRPLSPNSAARYGVSHHERLASGVWFRYERLTRHTFTKSNVQNSKIAAAMTELGIPPRLVMPTERVCGSYEKLLMNVQTLLDIRKVKDKVDGEIRVLLAERDDCDYDGPVSRIKMDKREVDDEKSIKKQKVEIDDTERSQQQPQLLHIKIEEKSNGPMKHVSSVSSSSSSAVSISKKGVDKSMDVVSSPDDTKRSGSVLSTSSNRMKKKKSN